MDEETRLDYVTPLKIQGENFQNYRQRVLVECSGGASGGENQDSTQFALAPFFISNMLALVQNGSARFACPADGHSGLTQVPPHGTFAPAGQPLTRLSKRAYHLLRRCRLRRAVARFRTALTGVLIP